MVRLKINEVLKAVSGRLSSGSSDGFINGVSTDSRTVRKGELFFALRGLRFDGQKFLGDVIKKGASGVVVSSPNFKSEIPVIHVADTLKALGDMAGCWRGMHPLPLIAVSGSCGKTTTKEMIASILMNSRSIIKTEGNLNNLIGLPLTIFSLNNIHKASVVELGISEKGEMNRLAMICRPDIAVLTNIGEAHTASLGDIKEIAHEKGELFRNVGSNGTIVINIDDKWIKKESESLKKKKITFSIKEKADVMLKDYSLDAEDRVSAVFIAMGDEIPVKLNLRGRHNLSNAAAAIAAVIKLGATREEIVNGLNAVVPVSGRMNIIKLSNGVTIIDDTYNANPLSMEAALLALSGMKGRKIAVLGDMLELGAISAEAHKRIGRFVKNAGINMLFSIGDFSNDVVRGAMDRGMLSLDIVKAMNKSELIKELNNFVQEGDILLIKGSRSAGMEDVVEGLKNAN